MCQTTFSAFQPKADFREQDTQTCSCDLDLDPMTFIYEPDLKILKMYLHAKMTFLGQGFRKLEQYRQTHRHTDTQTDATENITMRHSRVVIIILSK